MQPWRRAVHPFFCPSCQLQEHQQLILSLVVSVDVLKGEVRLLKLAQDIAKVTTSMPLRVGNAAQETSVQVSQPSKPPRSSNSGWAKVNSKKKQKSRRPPATVKQPVANQRGATENPNNSPPMSRKKFLPLSGARKIWGTLRSTTTLAVANALKQLAGIDTSKLQIKRMFKTSSTESSRVKKWWFVIRGEEDLLNKLEAGWNGIALQTAWKLQPVHVFDVASSHPADIDQEDNVEPLESGTLPHESVSQQHPDTTSI